MRKITKYGYLFLLIASVLTSGCRRSLEEDMGDTALIPIHIDWSESTLDPTKMGHASVWVFPKSGGKPFEHIMETNKVDDYITLPVGKYSIIVFNERIDAFETNDKWPLTFLGTDKYETFKVVTQDETAPYAKVYYTRIPTSAVRMPPNVISSWSLDEFEVTNEMIIVTRTRASMTIHKSPAQYGVTAPQEQVVDQQLRQLVEIKPKPLVRFMKIEVYVQNLSSAGKAQGRLIGATEGMVLATRKPIVNTVSHAFDLYSSTSLPPVWEDPLNKRNGWTFAQFYIFEHQSNIDYSIDLDFVLSDNTRVETIKHDVTHKVDKESIIIELKVGHEPGIDDPFPDKPEPDIVLPIPFGPPDVGVSGWDDEIIDLT